jgi:hypothetical protein
MAQRRTGTPGRARARADIFVDTIAAHGRILDLAAAERPWFVALADDVKLVDGAVADTIHRIPQADATRLLKGIIRFVVDVPARTNLRLVWTKGDDELWVDGSSIELTCTPGLVTISVVVGCDQLPRAGRRVAVPFAVGRADDPRGLLMSTFNRVDAPALIADRWSDSIVALCWEALLELTRRISAESGRDAAGRPLIPAAVAAEDQLLIVQPMARHDLSGLTG